MAKKNNYSNTKRQRIKLNTKVQTAQNSFRVTSASGTNQFSRHTCAHVKSARLQSLAQNRVRRFPPPPPPPVPPHHQSLREYTQQPTKKHHRNHRHHPKSVISPGRRRRRRHRQRHRHRNACARTFFIRNGVRRSSSMWMR